MDKLIGMVLIYISVAVEEWTFGSSRLINSFGTIKYFILITVSNKMPRLEVQVQVGSYGLAKGEEKIIRIRTVYSGGDYFCSRGFLASGFIVGNSFT